MPIVIYPVFNKLLRLSNTIAQPPETADESIKFSPSLVILTESGLYTAMIASRKPQAKTFRRWITCEVLPSIRKKGFYLHSPQGDTELSTTGETQANLEQKNTLFYKMISRLVDNQAKLQKQIQQFSQDNCDRLDQVEAVLSECKRQHDIFAGWKMIKMLVEDMTQLYGLTEEERRSYFTSLCQQYEISLPDKALPSSDTMHYDLKTLAHKLGLYTTTGRLHTSFLKALIQHLHLEKLPSSPAKKAWYSSQTVVSLHQWLQERNFPLKIALPSGNRKRQRYFELEYLRLN